ncbi:flagellar hook-associated protein 2 [Mesobacillus boroniphilus]|uniref:Flagellar hook-associated protein 2 n=1 Tax=Mesobacillus boroniphilus TaxID=308892 RepID=A0A944CNF3_9BACI|nr:flagellar hook-associated protein 2 [Mesobacillus boroniphilus]MBS8265790.1 flagellar hook-associated protein 2 [Mesobacillus boroniphilus]
MVRIGGLASGMDIDTLVGDLMKAERIPLNKLHQKKQIIEWQRDDYRAMNKLLADLDNFIFDGVFRQSTFSKKTVTTSNEAAVSVRNINATSNLNSSISVNRLAESANMVSSSRIGNTNFDPNGKLADQKDNFVTPYNTADTKIYIEAIGKDGSMPAAPVEITIDPANDSLNSVINKINNSNAGVVAFYDSVEGKVSITAKNSGDNTAGAEIKLSGNFLTNQLNLDTDSDIAAGASRGKVGTSAEFTINGLTTTRPTNTFVINGFEYTLKQTTGTNTVTVNSATDEEAVFKSITDFVNKYNETIAGVNSKVTEERFRKYQPLSDEEREGMTEKQAEMWDERAKSGMLRNDSILSGTLNKMRMDLYGRVGNDTDAVNDNYDQLAEIGITTSKNYLDRGKLVIDPNKLREAIKNDPNAIYKLFTNESTVESEQGIARKLRATIKNTITTIEGRAGNAMRTNAQFTLGRNLSSIDKQIDRFEDRLIKVEDRYWRQFTAMEKAIQKANEQSAYLMSQFYSG